MLDDFGAFVGRSRGCLTVRDRDRKEKRYPLGNDEISDVTIRSGNSISVGALVSCAYSKISVTILTGRGHPVAVLRSLYDDSHVATRLAQYESTRNGKGLEIAKTFLIAKLKGQDMLLSRYGLKRLDLFHTIERIKEADSQNKLTSIEGHCAERYFEQVLGLFNESVRPEKRKGFKAYDGINNIYNLTYTVLKWKVHQALWSAKLEPYLGFLHSIAIGKPSLALDFLELYRYLMDDFILSYARNLKPKDFALKGQECKREYLKDRIQNEYLKRLNAYFKSIVNVPRMRRGKRQELETLINEEAFLFAQYLRNEKQTWVPRIASLTY
jgi:CRISPR-associated protein Cas1